MLVYIAVVAIAILYGAASLSLFAFGTNLYLMSVRVRRKGKVEETPGPQLDIADEDLPIVTVQLPVFNELYVAERIIEACAEFDYPADKLQIQVLDDSTDETSLIIERACARVEKRGVWIEHLKRTDRVGYKAGALAAGLETAAGEYVAIFDADFVPESDFVRRTLAHFDADNVAFVQARWGHLNRDHSWLTKLQALTIDGHFLVEQSGRGQAGYWFNFNGTCGVWRVAAIEDAGGWKADTLTEDLDLSYRAYLAGWTARFAEEIVVPGEVPAQLTGFRRQQHRWARGSIQCAWRLLPQVWRTKERLPVKIQATLHLCAYFIQLLLLALVLLYPAVVWAGVQFPRFSTLFGAGYLLALTSLAPTVFFIVGSWRNSRSPLKDFPRILLTSVVGAGLMVNTARAALQIFTRPNPSFERTPKFGLSAEAEDGKRSWLSKRYQIRPDRIVFAELAVGAYSIFSAWVAWRFDNIGVFVYSLIFGAGVLSVAAATILHGVSIRVGRRRRDTAIRGENERITDRPAFTT